MRNAAGREPVRKRPRVGSCSPNSSHDATRLVEDMAFEQRVQSQGPTRGVHPHQRALTEVSSMREQRPHHHDIGVF